MNKIYHIMGHYETEQSHDCYVVASDEPEASRNKYMETRAIYDDDVIFYTRKEVKAGDNLFDDFYVDSIIDIM